MLLNTPSGTLHLLPQSAILVGKTLIAADLHLGKSAAFRANGIPVPEGDTARDLSRLADLVRLHQPSQLVIAGDLFHSASGTDPDLLARVSTFLEDIKIPLILADGNHDLKIRHLPLAISRVAHFDLDRFRIIHDPAAASPAHFNICGHIHPVLRIPDGKRTSLRLPCFHLRHNILTLPSFGSFTGGHLVDIRNSDRFFVTLQEKIVEIPKTILTPPPKN